MSAPRYRSHSFTAKRFETRSLRFDPVVVVQLVGGHSEEGES